MDLSIIKLRCHPHRLQPLKRLFSRLYRAHGRRSSVVEHLRQDIYLGLIAVGFLECSTRLYDVGSGCHPHVCRPFPSRFFVRQGSPFQ